MIEDIRNKYAKLFSGNPILIKAPGRINLIGEHTDYNLGFVLPAAINKYIYFAMGQSEKKEVATIYSTDFDQQVEINLESGAASEDYGWASYLSNALLELKERGYPLKGFNCVMSGDIPLGAGLSSSAALCCGFVMGISKLVPFEITRQEIALVGQATEHRVGTNCGLMDQYASLFGKENQALCLDCKDLSFNHFPLELGEYSLLLINSNIKHKLAAGSAYNQRRASCEEAVAIIQKEHPDIKSLRDVDQALLSSYKSRLPAESFKRAQYVLHENQRLQDAVKAMEEGDIKKVGALIYQSHKGLSEEYEVSIPELDLLVNITKEIPSVLGSRMMGGGFGGCTLNLLLEKDKEEIKQKVRDAYFKQTSIEPEFIEVNTSDGVGVV